VIKIDEYTQNRGLIVWNCPILKEDSTLRPAGLTPRKGCGHWNRMTTKHGRVPEIFQTSPCKKCFKRTRQIGNMYYFDNELEALLFIEQKKLEEEEE
jgi:hypothetical protein